MTGTWRLSQALAALHGGIRNLREQDADLAVDINEALPDEAAAVQDAILGVARAAVQAERLSDLSAAAIKDQQDRKRRFDARNERLRGIVFAALEALGIRKIEAHDLTVNAIAGRSSVILTDETLIPADYWRVKREPDRTKIAEDLKVGVVIPGCELSNALPTIQIRSK